LGRAKSSSFIIKKGNETVADIPIKKLKDAWTAGFAKEFRY